MRRQIGLSLVVLGLAGARAALAVDNPVLVKLSGSASGSVTLFQSGERVLVNVEFADLKLSGATVSIIEGTCNRAGRSAYALSESVNGQSQTELASASVASLTARPHAIVVRRSGRSNAPEIACGNIRG